MHHEQDNVRAIDHLTPVGSAGSAGEIGAVICTGVPAIRASRERTVTDLEDGTGAAGADPSRHPPSRVSNKGMTIIIPKPYW